MSKQTFPRDRFDEVPEHPARVGAHRAEHPRTRPGRVLLWAVLATVVLIAAGVFTTSVISGRISFSTETATPIPTVTPQLDTSYAVLVLNATTQTGLADSVRQEVVAAGWDATNVAVANASTQDFPRTTVYYATVDDESPALALAAAIGGADVAESAQYQADAATKQLTIVVGQDRAPGLQSPAA